MSKNFDSILEKLDDIPTLSAVASKVNELLNDPDSTASDVATLVKRDQVLTAKVLRMVNSPYYGIPGGVSDVGRALGFLGFNTVAQIVMSLSVFSMFELQDESLFSLPLFWKHCMGVAFTSEQLAKKARLPNSAEAFTCGLLHDIGKTVLMTIDRAHFDSVVKGAKKETQSFYDFEKFIEAPTHTLIGEKVIMKWGLPTAIANVVRYHHYPNIDNLSVLTENHRNLVLVVRYADLLSYEWGFGNSGNFNDHSAELKLIGSKNIFKDVKIDEIKEKVVEALQGAGSILRAA